MFSTPRRCIAVGAVTGAICLAALAPGTRVSDPKFSLTVELHEANRRGRLMLRNNGPGPLKVKRVEYNVRGSYPPRLPCTTFFEANSFLSGSPLQVLSASGEFTLDEGQTCTLASFRQSVNTVAWWPAEDKSPQPLALWHQTMVDAATRMDMNISLRYAVRKRLAWLEYETFVWSSGTRLLDLVSAL